MDEEFGDFAKELSELPSSHNPEQRPEPADNTHRGMKYCIYYTWFLAKFLPCETTKTMCKKKKKKKLCCYYIWYPKLTDIHTLSCKLGLVTKKQMEFSMPFTVGIPLHAWFCQNS